MGDFAFKFHVRTKVDGFDWALFAVYGAAQPEHKPIVSELVRICGYEKLPTVILTSLVDKMKRIMATLMVDGQSFLMLLLKIWI